MSELVERGAKERNAESVVRAQQEATSQEKSDVDNRRRTLFSQVHGFLPRFYEDRWIVNPAWTRPYCGEPRMIENPEKPFPAIEWRSLNPGDYRAASEFTCEGLTFRCYWRAELYGDDRAEWDDGWWSTFVLVHGRWPFRKETKVYDPASVANVLGR